MIIYLMIRLCDYFSLLYISTSQWLRGLRRKSAATRPLRLQVRNPPGACMSVCCKYCVLSGRILCDELIPCPEESYRMCCVVCDLETSWMRRPWPTGGWWTKIIYKYLCIYFNYMYKTSSETTIKHRDAVGSSCPNFYQYCLTSVWYFPNSVHLLVLQNLLETPTNAFWFYECNFIMQRPLA
jgi:hypothetical protein